MEEYKTLIKQQFAKKIKSLLTIGRLDYNLQPFNELEIDHFITIHRSEIDKKSMKCMKHTKMNYTN